MAHLSWSQLTMHEKCPFEWYTKYVLKAIPYAKNIHFTVGSAAHAAVEAAMVQWGSMGKLTIPEMVGIYVNYLKKEGVVDPDDLIYWTMCGQNMLGAWYSWATQHHIEVLVTEQKVTRDDFVGVVDCIAKIDDQLYIIDWKTSSSKYTQEKVDKDGQVTAYMWLTDRYDAQVAYGILVKGLSMFQFLPSTRTKEDVDQFLIRVAVMRHEIIKYSDTDLVPRNVGSQCDMCDLYPNMCEGRDDF